MAPNPENPKDSKFRFNLESLPDLLAELEKEPQWLTELLAASEQDYSQRLFVKPTDAEMQEIIEFFDGYTFIHNSLTHQGQDHSTLTLVIGVQLPFQESDGSSHMRITVKQQPIEQSIRLDMGAFPFVLRDSHGGILLPSCEPGHSLYFKGLKNGESYIFERRDG